MSGGWHLFHFVLTLLTGLIWAPIWLICALISGSSNRKRDLRMRGEELELLRRIAERDVK